LALKDTGFAHPLNWAIVIHKLLTISTTNPHAHRIVCVYFCGHPISYPQFYPLHVNNGISVR